MISSRRLSSGRSSRARIHQHAAVAQTSPAAKRARVPSTIKRKAVTSGHARSMSACASCAVDTTTSGTSWAYRSTPGRSFPAPKGIRRTELLGLYQMLKGFIATASQPGPGDSHLGGCNLTCPASPEWAGTSVTVPSVDITSLLTANAGPIVGGLIGSVATILGVLITRGTVRSSSQKERTDEYRREVRSAASSIVRTAHTFMDSANAFEKSIFWIEDAVRATPDHDESYLACQTAKAELDEKVADFTFLVDIDVLSKAAFRLYVNALMAYNAIATINMSSEWPKYCTPKITLRLSSKRSTSTWIY